MWQLSINVFQRLQIVVNLLISKSAQLGQSVETSGVSSKIFTTFLVTYLLEELELEDESELEEELGLEESLEIKDESLELKSDNEKLSVELLASNCDISISPSVSSTVSALEVSSSLEIVLEL